MASHLPSLDPAAPAIVIGASGGLGAAFVALLAAERPVLALSRRPASGLPPGAGAGVGVKTGAEGGAHAGVQVGAIDILDEASIAAAAGRVALGPAPGLILVATGLLHDGAAFQPEKDWRQLDPAALARAYAVNAIGPALVAKHFLPLLPRDGRALFAAISARVGSISDNRTGGWYGYRAAKAGLNQLLRCLAVEAARKRPHAVIAGLHPGTVRTPLSAPFRGPDAPGLAAPEAAAARLLAVLDRLTPATSGRLWDPSGAEIAP